MAAVEAGIGRRDVCRLLGVFALMLLGACAQPGRPVIADRSPVFDTTADSYVVQPGDTLYSIAWRFGKDYRALARANGITSPYTIYVGQRVRLTEQSPQPARRTSTPPAGPPAGKPRVTEPPARRSDSAPPRPPVARTTAPGDRTPPVAGWRPPTEAPARRRFGNGSKGIDYALGPEHQVRAAAGGDVVYAGSGLGGFRHLVIVKHDPQYLSAYSLDRPITVREGQRIQAGELLADKEQRGRSGTLHFEIRRHGDPVDPTPLIAR